MILRIDGGPVPSAPSKNFSIRSEELPVLVTGGRKRRQLRSNALLEIFPSEV
jgi:hypothetical protein